MWPPDEAVSPFAPFFWTTLLAVLSLDHLQDGLAKRRVSFLSVAEEGDRTSLKESEVVIASRWP